MNSNRRTARSRSFRDLVQSRRIRLRNATNGVLDDTDTAGPSNYKSILFGCYINDIYIFSRTSTRFGYQ